MTTNRIALGLACLTSLASMQATAAAYAEEKKGTDKATAMSSLPAPVQAAIKKATRGAKIEEIEVEEEDGETAYSVEASRGEVEFELTFSSKGAVTGFELGDEDDKQVAKRAKPPKAARAAIQALAGAGNTVAIEAEDENGVTVFEGSWMAEGLACEAVVTAAGDVVEREQQVSFASLPEAVKAAAKKLLPKGVEPMVEMKTVLIYEVEAEIDGEEEEWLFSATGQEAEVEIGNNEHEEHHED